MNKCGIGSSHVITRLGHYVLKRWGVWSPWATILVSKIYPVDQIYHNHEGDFVSFLLWGRYWEEVQEGNNKFIRRSNWFNIVQSGQYHRVHCDKLVWTLLIMGPRKQKVTAKIKGKVYPYTKVTKRYR